MSMIGSSGFLDERVSALPPLEPKKMGFSLVPVPAVEQGLVDSVIRDSINQSRWKRFSAPQSSVSPVSVASYYRQEVERMVKEKEIETTPEIEQFLDELRGMLELEKEIQTIKTTIPGKELPEQLGANLFIQLMQHKLQELKKGKSILMRGGWKAADPEEDSCAILYRITKKNEREFVFELYNTGEGLEYHPRGTLQEQEVFVQRLQKTVAAPALLDPLFWQAQYELLHNPPAKATPCGPSGFYNWLDQLEGSSFIEKARQETLGRKDVEFRRPQRGKNGLCDTLFLYTKSYFRGKQRPIYHTLKRKLQVATFKKYWDGIRPSEKTDPHILDSLSQKIEKIQKGLFKDVSKGRVAAVQVEATVQALKEHQSVLRDLREKSFSEVVSSPMKEGLVPASIEENQQKSPLVMGLSSATTVTLNKSILSLFLELENKSLIVFLLDKDKQLSDIDQLPSSIFDQQIWHLPSHADKMWDALTDQEATAVFQKLTACVRRVGYLNLTDLSVLHLYVHLFALLVKLAPKTKDSFLSTMKIDRQFVSRFVEPPFSSLITCLDAEQAKQFADNLAFLLGNTQEKGLFHEYFDQEPRIVCAKNPKPGSLGYCYREYWNSMKSVKEVRQLLTTDLVDPVSGNPKPELDELEKDLDHPEWVQRFALYRDPKSLQALLLSQKKLLNEDVPDVRPKILEEMESVLVEMQRRFRIHTRMKFEREVGTFSQPKREDLVVKDITLKNEMFAYEFRLMGGSSLEEKERRFLDCFTSRSEGEIRDAYAGKELAVEEKLDFEFALIHSADDPSLRIARAIEFFRGHKELLKQERCRKFLWATLFQISLRGSTTEEHIPLVHYLHTTKDGWEQISKFVEDGYALFKDDLDPELAMGFWELAITIADYQRVFFHKKTCLLPCDALVQLVKKMGEESPRLSSCVSRYCSLFPETIPTFNPLIKDRSAFADNVGEYERGRWPFPVYRSIFAERFKGLQAKERDDALSQYVFGVDNTPLRWQLELENKSLAFLQGGVVNLQTGEIVLDVPWNLKKSCTYPPEQLRALLQKRNKYSCGDYTVDLQSGEVFVRGCAEPLMPPSEEIIAILQRDSFWKQTFSEKNIHFIGSFNKEGEEPKMLFIDTETQEEYIADCSLKRKAIQGFYYRKKGSSAWESLLSIHRFSSDPQSILHTMGLTAQKGWSIEKNSDGRLFLRKETELAARFQLVEEGSSFQLNDLSNPDHPLVMIDPQKRLDPFCQKLRKLDKNGFFWAERTQEGVLSVKQFYSPRWQRTFLIGEGRIHDAETGWEYLPDFTLRALSEVPPDWMVFKDPVSQQRRVLLVDPLPDAQGKTSLYQFNVDPKGRHLTSTTREEDLYLAEVFLRNKKYKAALSCLNQSGRRTGGYTLKELRLLKDIFYQADQAEETLSICLKSALLLKHSLDASGLRWEEPKNGEQAEVDSLREFVKKLNVSRNFLKYRSLITAWPNALKLRNEDSLEIMRFWPSTNERGIPWRIRLGWKWDQYIAEFSLDQREFLKTTLDSLKTDWAQQSAFLDQSLPPLRTTVKEGELRFAQFYNIAKKGTKKQREQLENWLRAFLALHPEEKSCVVFVRFFLRLLRLGGRGRAGLKDVALLVGWKNSKEKKSMMDALHQSVGIFPCFMGGKVSRSDPLPLSPSLHSQSVRKKQLQVVEAPMQRFSVKGLLQHIQERGKTELLPQGELGKIFIEKKKETGEDTAISIPPLDPHGGAAYAQSFTNLETSLHTHQKSMKDRPEWAMSAENRTALFKQIQEELKIEKTKFNQKKTELLGMARGFLPREKQLEWDLGVASQFQGVLKWSDVLFLFAKQDLQLYRQRISHLTEEQAYEIYTKTAECLCELTRLQRLEQAEELLQQMGEAPDSRLVGQLKTLLEGKESYPVDEYPSILLFEALTKKQLRKDQLDNLSKLTDPQSHWLIEAIMGSGKSEILMPLFAQTVADGQHLSITVIPKEQMHSAGSRLERRLQELFDQDSVRIDWKNVSKEHLQAIYARLQKAMQKGQVLRLYADELQHFFLEEQALFAAHVQGNADALEQLKILRSIRQLFKEKGVALVDEVHLQLMRKRECQKPLGEKQSVPSSYRDMATQLQGLLISKEIRKKFFLQIHKTPWEGAIPFVAEQHKEELIVLLAQAFVKQSKLRSTPENIMGFFIASDEKASETLQKLDEFERETLSFARGQIRTILPATLSRKCGEDYGCFPPLEEGAAPSYLAGPFRLSCPVYGSTFATPDELLAFTIQSYLIQGVSLPLVKEMFDQLLQKGKQQKLLSNIDLRETRAYASYVQIMGKDFAISLDTLDFDNHYQKIVEAINGDPATLLRFIEHFVLPKVEQYPVTAFVNGYSFFSRFL